MSSVVPRGSIHSFGTSDFISIRCTVLAGISVVTGTQHQRGKKTAWHVLYVHRYMLRRGAKGVSTPPVHYASRRWSVSHLQARNGRRFPYGVGPGLEPHGRVQTLRLLRGPYARWDRLHHGGVSWCQPVTGGALPFISDGASLHIPFTAWAPSVRTRCMDAWHVVG